MTKRKDGTYTGPDGVDRLYLFTEDRPVTVLNYAGIGHGGDGPSFADGRGNMVWHLHLDVDPRAETVELARDKGSVSYPRDPRAATISLRINADRIPGLIRELLSVYVEREAAFPVTRRANRLKRYYARGRS